jgi:2-C-methyl-D-erythritol 4-phosphate cytidylyltransferase / 2-C-methyl-D-erythritol 2,4-cyclodiphosphate synthase
LLGRPLISWSFDVLSAAGCDPLVVVIPSGADHRAREAVGVAALLVEGGETRSESVRRGLEAVDSELVVVHDAVRPLLTVDLVDRVVDALNDSDAAIAAVPLDETVKRVRESFVSATIDRDELWRAQTPQAFRTELLRDAHARALQDDVDATDDAQMIERIGGRVRVVEGERTNIKVTWPGDFELAESLLRRR